MRTLLRGMRKILLLPVSVTLKIVSGILLGIMHLASIAVGPFLTLLIVLGIFCLVHQEWRNIMILAGIAAGIAGICFLAGYIAAAAESLSEVLLS